MEEKLEERKAYVLLEHTIFEVVLVARKCVEKCFKIRLNLAVAVALRMFTNSSFVISPFEFFSFLFGLDVQNGCDNHYDGVRQPKN